MMSSKAFWLFFSAGSAAAAVSDNVNVTLLAFPLPASDITSTFWPPGPTSSTSTSLAQVWLRFLSLTVTVLIVPPSPATLITDGYGVPAP